MQLLRGQSIDITTEHLHYLESEYRLIQAESEAVRHDLIARELTTGKPRPIDENIDLLALSELIEDMSDEELLELYAAQKERCGILLSAVNTTARAFIYQNSRPVFAAFGQWPKWGKS